MVCVYLEHVINVLAVCSYSVCIINNVLVTQSICVHVVLTPQYLLSLNI